ncbi:hypothetical protein II5_03157 [Bacillus cereus MSX-A1]|uniref:hypothetical protein n=1 Tax=Bacillus TaxID=1386 RepID=UPI0002796FEC|nr:hypothetical protein [Bacillus cereus]EJR05167.1 hypothetical protein II5_03157 [Bacillus cereus MSX-A1]MDR4294134.1 hypothetical protein [Bacillus cereus]
MKVFSDVEVFQCLKEYYNSFIDEGIIKIVKDDNDILVWEEQKSGYKIAISREKFISPKQVRRPWKMYWVSRLFQEYNYKLDNPQIEFFKDKGFYIKNTAEFLFHYTLIESEYPDHPMLKFNIDDVEFEIGEPSDMFKVMFHHISDDDNFEWENIHTIKLKNVDKKMLESYLQHAMYIIHKFAPSDLVGDYPQVYQYLYTHDYFTEPEEIIEGEVSNNFRMGKYTDPISFYNEGKQKKDFLSFYKVLEYFFIINRKDDFEAHITTYIKDKDLDEMIRGISDVYNDKERNLIEILINKIEHIEPILELAFSKGLISNQDDKKEFANNLYEYRNSRVHGKGGANFELLVPAILNSDDSNEWEIIIENLAELVILQFCYSQSE